MAEEELMEALLALVCKAETEGTGERKPAANGSTRVVVVRVVVVAMAMVVNKER